MEHRKIFNSDEKNAKLGTPGPSLLGYGCMRFPTKGDDIDEEQSLELLKKAVEGGVNYFDTAYIYHNSQSESFLGKFLAEHMTLPREKYYVATKLPTWEVKTLDDAKRIFAEQLKRLRVDYIDFYLLHDLKIDRFENMEKLGVYEYCRELQKEGKIKHLGHSTHENLENFTKIVNARDWDFILMQLNYMDLEHLKMYDLCEKKGIPLLAMETVKGGSLAKLPENIMKNLTDIDPNATASSFAVRWTGSLPNVKIILSGMTAMDQVVDNLKTCTDFKPLSEKEQAAVKKVETELRKRVFNGCTGCNYCMPCPSKVNIPWCFSIWNEYGIYDNRGHTEWTWTLVPETDRPDKCTECGKCLKLCPQELDIIGDLKKVTKVMAKA